MLVRAPEIEIDGDEAALVAVLEPERRRRPLVLRLAVHSEYEDWLDRTGTPFVPVATVLASAMGEDLRLEAPASPMLVRGAESVSRAFASWWGYRAARIEAPPHEPGPRGNDVGVLFSGGVDTSATLIRSLRGDVPERATHLLSMYGSEFKLSAATHEAIWRENVEAAREYGLPLVKLTTNAPEVFRGHIGWPRSHGATFASLALALGPRFGTVLFGATQLPDEDRPHGSRADIDPLWSTETTAMRQDAAEIGKVRRAAIVATSPIALAHLKVCWVEDRPRNCGRCDKCLRTMTYLELAGALDRTDRFDAPLTAEAIRACKPAPVGVIHIRELVGLLPPDHHLRDAWAQTLHEAEAGVRETRRLERRRARRRPVRRLVRRTRRRARRLRRGARRRLRSLRANG